MLSFASVSRRVFVQSFSYENEFDLHENKRAVKTDFHINGFARRLVLTLGQKTSRKCSKQASGILHQELFLPGEDATLKERQLFGNLER